MILKWRYSFLLGFPFLKTTQAATGLDPWIFELSNTSTDITNVGSSISIYPNPISNSFTIKNEAANLLEVYDVFGRMILRKNLKKNIKTIERNNLKNGLYFFKFLNNDQLINTKKIIFE